MKHGAKPTTLGKISYHLTRMCFFKNIGFANRDILI